MYVCMYIWWSHQATCNSRDGRVKKWGPQNKLAPKIALELISVFTEGLYLNEQDAE